MSVLPPVQHLEAVSRDFPRVWKQYAHFLAIRRELGDWPSWCYCPMAAAYAVVSGGGDNTVPLERATEIARVAALAAWRPTQGIYRFDPTLLRELLETPLDGELPTDHLQRLPEWCVYVQLDSPETRGFFAHLEYDSDKAHNELRLLLDSPDHLIPIALHLGGTIEQAVASFVAHANVRLRGLPVPAFSGAFVARVTKLAAPLVSVLLYLCARDAEVRPTRDPRRTHEPAAPKRRPDGELYLPPARRLEVWEVGFQLGAALRAAEQDAGSADGSRPGPRGHIRRAHWHSFWKGTGEARRLDLRWLPPIPVNLATPERPTVHKVTKD